MKKYILSTVLVSTILLGVAQPVSAAEDKDFVKEASSRVGIEFEGDSIVVDPDGQHKGALSFVFKPDMIEFGKVKAVGADIVVPSTNLKDENNKQWLVVNDDRDNDTVTETITNPNSVKGGAWTLTAKMDPLMSGQEELPATMTLELGNSQTYNMGTKLTEDGNNYIPNLPNGKDEDGKDVITSTPAKDVTVAKDNIVSLTAGKAGEVEVMTKAKANGEKVGAATHVKDAKLAVHAGKELAGKKYASKVTWTLRSTAGL
jgi:hypothetical protein